MGDGRLYQPNELEISDIEGGEESRISPKFPIFEMEGVAGWLGLGAAGEWGFEI